MGAGLIKLHIGIDQWNREKHCFERYLSKCSFFEKPNKAITLFVAQIFCNFLLKL